MYYVVVELPGNRRRWFKLMPGLKLGFSKGALDPRDFWAGTEVRDVPGVGPALRRAPYEEWTPINQVLEEDEYGG